MQYIHSRISPDSINKVKRVRSSRGLQSSYVDYVSQGYVPGSFEPFYKINQSNTQPGQVGVLCEFHNEIMADSNRPTLNNMLFPIELLDKCIVNNKFVKSAMELNCMWMGPQHDDFDSVESERVAGRIIEMLIVDGFLVGSYQIMDTPLGRNLYLLMKSGATLSTSTRGVGELIPIKDSVVSLVDPDKYSHITSDFVGFAAVPNAFISTTKRNNSPTLDRIHEELGNLLQQGLRLNPNDRALKLMFDLYSKKSSDLTEHYRDYVRSLEIVRDKKTGN